MAGTNGVMIGNDVISGDTSTKAGKFRWFQRIAKGLGGAEGNRTPDLCSAIAALSHLSYSPEALAF
jgi:hypothetical protein